MNNLTEEKIFFTRKITVCNNSGFTLIELMFTLLIASILIIVSVGGFGSIVRANAVDAGINNLASDIATAKSEAIKTGYFVYIESVDDSGNWHLGHKAWVDRDGADGYTAPADLSDIEDDEDISLGNFLARTDGVTIIAYRSNGNTGINLKRIVVNPEGTINMYYTNAGSLSKVNEDVSFEVCSGDKCKKVEVSFMGRVRQFD